MNKRLKVIASLFFLIVFAFSTSMIWGASVVELTPPSGEPGDTVAVEGSDFAALDSLGMGFGGEAIVINEPVTPNGDHFYLWGVTANRPIKPGSFSWTYTVSGYPPFEFVDNGDGTLSKSWSTLVTETSINYTTGLFSRSTETPGEYVYEDSMVNYTTFEFDVTPAGLATGGSGGLSGEFTVPDIWNGTHAVTVIDSAGNLAATTFEVYGSDIIPEPLTIGAIVLLSSASLIVSFYWLRKKPTNKTVKYS